MTSLAQSKYCSQQLIIHLVSLEPLLDYKAQIPKFWRRWSHIFISITPMSTLTLCGSTYWASIYRSTTYVRNLFVFNRNTWNHKTVCKLFGLRIVSYSNNCLQRIIIILLARLSTSVDWFSFTRVWVIANLLRSPRPFSVFWPILTIQ